MYKNKLVQAWEQFLKKLDSYSITYSGQKRVKPFEAGSIVTTISMTVLLTKLSTCCFLSPPLFCSYLPIDIDTILSGRSCSLGG